MMQIEVFDPAMCCSTGVCGTSVDPALATFAADLDWLAEHGAGVRRFNLGQEPGAFAENEHVRTLLQERGEDALPIVLVNGAVHSTGRYPTRHELASWAGIPPAAAVSPELVAELAAIGAAIGSNCEPCFKYHYDQARKLGLSKADVAIAVRTAQAVKSVPAAKMLDLAAKLLAVDPTDLGARPAPVGIDATPPADTGCCGGAEPVQLTSGPTAMRCCS